MGRNLVLLFVLLMASSAFASTQELTVYTYSAFTSEWGPGEALKRLFEKDCGCLVKYVAVDDGATLLKRLKLEGKKTKADVALGFDSNMGAEAVESKLFAPSEFKLQQNVVAPMPAAHRTELVPFDFGWIAVMYDSQKIKNPPKDMNDLLTRADFAKSLLLEDPRTSAPGLAFLVWLEATYGEKWSDELGRLRKQTLTVSPGWTEAYGLFTKGEAPMVVSYTTSEIYHRVAEKSDRYRAAIFPAHFAITEYAAVTRASRQKELSRKFLQFLLTNGAQKVLAENNWMYPAVDAKQVEGLNSVFLTMPQPAKTLLPKTDSQLQRKLVDRWLRDFR